MTHLVHRKERVLQHVARALKAERTERDRRVGIQLTDGSFSLVLELENLRQSVVELRTLLATQEPKIREQMRSEWQTRVDALENDLQLVRNQFSSYKAETTTSLIAGLHDVRSEAMAAMTNQSTPFDIKRTVLVAASHDRELAQAGQQADQLKIMMLRMKSMFDIKEKKLRTQYEAELQAARVKLQQTSRLWVQVSDFEKREKVLVEEVKVGRSLLESAHIRIAQLEAQVDFQMEQATRARVEGKKSHAPSAPSGQAGPRSSPSSAALPMHGVSTPAPAHAPSPMPSSSAAPPAPSSIVKERVWLQQLESAEGREKLLKKTLAEEQRARNGLEQRIAQLEGVVSDALKIQQDVEERRHVYVPGGEEGKFRVLSDGGECGEWGAVHLLQFNW